MRSLAYHRHGNPEPDSALRDTENVPWGEDVDAYAAESQARAEKAWNSGYFTKSVVPVKDINGVTVLDHDEHRRPGSTVESLGKLKAAFAALLIPAAWAGVRAIDRSKRA